MIRPRELALCVAIMAMVTACGGGEAVKERPLTSDEAATMAMVQYSNMQAEGATFTVSSATTTTGDTLNMTGEVDWLNHTGHAVVTATGIEQPVTEVQWNKNEVLERRSDLAAFFPVVNRDPRTWVSRGIDPTNRTLDRVIGILTRLSSNEPDNALLIQQQEGSAFLRTDTLRNTPANVYRYGKTSIYWLDTDTNAMLRFEGNSSSFTAPIVVDINARGPQSIALPSPEMVITVTDFKKLYESTTNP